MPDKGQATESAAQALLMKFGEGFGLSSVSPGCVQVEAYLRMADIDFATQVMKTAGTSPTGSLPAVEMQHGLGGHTGRSRDDLEAALSAIAFIKQQTDLDARLPGATAAECAAFNCLVDSRLAEALRFSMWCEWASVSQLPALYGDTLPWPLNYFIPYSQAVAAKQRFKGRDATQIYKGAKDCLEALELRCGLSEGPYLLGKRPCSLDAHVYGLCAYIAAAGTAAPVLKEALVHAPALRRYVGRIADTHFELPAPSFDEVHDTKGWSSAGSGEDGVEAKVLTAEERRQRRRSWWWLGGASVAVVAYLVLGGDYLQIVDVVDADDEEAEDE